MKSNNKLAITDKHEIYLALILCAIITTLSIVNRVYIPAETQLFIFLKDIEFIFIVGIIVALNSGSAAKGSYWSRGLEKGVSWETTKGLILKQNVLKKDEDIKRVINYGIIGGRLAIRFDVLTDQRILRYKKYFGITEEITFAGIKGFNYSLSFMVMTIRFDTEGGIKIFEIVMIKPLQKETASVLEQIMQEKSIPKNASL